MRKYNKNYHNSIVNNYRRELESKMKISTLNYTDEELYNVIEYWTGMSTQEEQMEAVAMDVNASVKR